MLIARDPARRCARGVVVVAAAAGLAACTSGGTATPSSAPPSSAGARTSSAPRPTPKPTPTAPIVVGPSATAQGDCPLIDLPTAMDDVGQRLDHSTVTTSAGKVTGCDFYPVTGYYAGPSQERLPDPNQPSLRIRLTRYANTVIAQNAMVLAAKADPDATSISVSGADHAISFATTFYPPDGNQDSAIVMQKATTVVLIQIADTKSSANIMPVADTVAAKL